MCSSTFAYSTTDDWTSLPNNVKTIQNEKKFKEGLQNSLQKEARVSEENPYMYY